MTNSDQIKDIIFIIKSKVIRALEMNWERRALQVENSLAIVIFVFELIRRRVHSLALLGRVNFTPDRATDFWKFKIPLRFIGNINVGLLNDYYMKIFFMWLCMSVSQFKRKYYIQLAKKLYRAKFLFSEIDECIKPASETSCKILYAYTITYK